MSMFDSLLAFKPDADEAVVAVKNATAQEVFNAQAKTADWLDELGAPTDADIDARKQQNAARRVFEGMLSPAKDLPDADKPTLVKLKHDQQKNVLMTLKTPTAVKHLTAMLTEYDWDFIDHAKKIRSYAVAKLLDESTHPDARIRLSALKLLGTVTEVALFTERVEITKKDISEEELEAKLREKLSKYVIDITPEPPPALDLDAEIGEVAEKRTEG